MSAQFTTEVLLHFRTVLKNKGESDDLLKTLATLKVKYPTFSLTTLFSRLQLSSF